MLITGGMEKREIIWTALIKRMEKLS